MSPRGRHAKSKARITSYEDLLSQESEKRAKDLEIYIPPGPRLGDIVIETKDVSKAYGDNLLVEGMTFSLPRGGIVGVIGPNGAGKTTLFRMITGQEKPDGGTIRIGETVSWDTSIKAATRSTQTRAYGKRSPAGWTQSNSASGR
jgi:ATPase subunit of ABC transporter with duplicated ATPase domains